MRKIVFILFIIGSVWCLTGQQQEEILRETVEVVNVEVPVRVYDRGNPVGNLVRTDFKLYENGVLQKIKGFFQIRKRIKLQDIHLTAGLKERKIYPPRYFVLIFNLVDYNQNLEKGLDFLFNKVLRKNDRLLIIINNEQLPFNDLSDKEAAFKKIIQVMKDKGDKTKVKLLNILKQINQRILEIKIVLNEEGGRSAADELSKRLHQLFKWYYFSWTLFKREFLTPDINTFYNFSSHLEKIKNEKWVINFHQQVSFPQFRETSEWIGRYVDRLESREFHNVTFEMKAETEFPSEEVSKLFYKVNATFHLILIPTRIDIVDEELEFKTVSTALENCYRDISKKTGGDVVLSANLETAIDKISEKEDIYYMLTYSPKEPKKTGTIKVELTNKNYNYKISYDKNTRADYFRDFLERKKAENPEIKIKQLGFKGRKLFLTIKDFLLKKEKKRVLGKVNLRIRIEDERGEIIYDKDKIMNPVSTIASVQIDLSWLKKGRYYLFVDATDQLTGKSYPDYISTEIDETRTRIKRVDFGNDLVEPVKRKVFDDKLKKTNLDIYLSGAAEYCKKLRKKAFHFFCKERITITARDFRPLTTRGDIPMWFKHGFSLEKLTNKYVFDYQLLHKKQKVKEQRRLVSKKGVEVPAEELISSFLSERALFGPHTLLSEEKQNRFIYEIQNYTKQKKQEFVIVRIVPKKYGDVFFSSAKVWVNMKDFSIRKISLIPRYIEGYEQLVQIADYINARLFLKCEIEYDQEYQGLYFPTQVRILETYKGGRSIVRNFGFRGWERTRTIYTYKDYKFFNVDVDVKQSENFDNFQF